MTSAEVIRRRVVALDVSAHRAIVDEDAIGEGSEVGVRGAGERIWHAKHQRKKTSPDAIGVGARALAGD